MDKVMVGFIWFLSLAGAVFFGHEAAMMKHDKSVSAMNDQLQRCNQVIARNLYVNDAD